MCRYPQPLNATSIRAHKHAAIEKNMHPFVLSQCQCPVACPQFVQGRVSVGRLRPELPPLRQPHPVVRQAVVGYSVAEHRTWT